MVPQGLNSEAVVQLRPALARPAPGTRALDVSDEWEASSPRGVPTWVRTIFLRGSECRFHCVMCDLWRFTHEGPTPAGAITEQVRHGLAYIAPAMAPAGDQRDSPCAPQWLKLYNASSFFDPYNVPIADLPEIAGLVSSLERVIVENHPRILPWPAITEFQQHLAGQLEVALGLETVDPAVLKKLNKGITTDDFARAADGLRGRDIDVRAFVLLRPPWTEEAAALDWCYRSIEFAIEHGARHVTVIPVRGGNGALEWLAEQGQFEPPKAESLEQAVQTFLRHEQCVITADLWDWQKLRGLCADCREPRRLRLERMNVTRINEPPVHCGVCNV